MDVSDMFDDDEDRPEHGPIPQDVWHNMRDSPWPPYVPTWPTVNEDRYNRLCTILNARKGDWIETYLGNKSYIIDPRPEDFEVEDIAHALSNLCRFGGHTRRFFSVAEHSINVANALWDKFHARELALMGLFHDASEAYLVDIPSPVKPYLNNYKELEKKIQDTIYSKFANIPNEYQYPELKKIDQEQLWIEGYQLMKSGTDIWENDGDRDELLPIAKEALPLNCWSPEEAKHRFLLTYRKFSAI